MNLRQRIQREGVGLILKLSKLDRIEKGDDQQHRVGAETLRLQQLIFIQDKILAQEG